MNLARTVVAVLSFLMLGALGCDNNSGASSGSSNDNTIRILWADWQPADALAELGKDYEKATDRKSVV